MPKEEHGDFGEVIGGAKKDQWKSRGLNSSDLNGMNDREIDRHLKKENIWKKPDYEGLIQSGVPVEAAFYIKTVRDAVPVRPLYFRTDDTAEKKAVRQRQYVDTVKEVQSVIESVKTKEDVFAAFQKLIIKGGYYYDKNADTDSPLYAPTPKGADNPIISKIVREVRVSEFDYHYLSYDAKKRQFGVPKAEKLPKGYAVHFYEGGGFSRGNDWKENTYYLAKGNIIVKTNIETEVEARKIAQEIAGQATIRKTGKQRFTPPQFKSIQRDGHDYREGRDIAGQDYLHTFGFRGGEFGNWMSQADRQASLNFGFDALKDLAAVLQIADKDISYNGKLAIAFGSRGSGNAAAHYEPDREVINLTKMKGAGSLAHEWWHGLDDYLGKQQGVKGLLTNSPRKNPLFQKLINTMKYRPVTQEEAKQGVDAQKQRLTKNAESWLHALIERPMKQVLDKHPDINSRYEILKTEFYNGESGSVSKLSDLKKEVTNRVIPKADREKLEVFEGIFKRHRNAPETPITSTGKVETNFFKNSKEMDKGYGKDGGYWQSNEEMSARAFACYVMDKLPYNSDYLIGHAESGVGMKADKDGNTEAIKAFPDGNEREAINAVFDEIIQELKQEKIFSHEEKPLLKAGSEQKKAICSDRSEKGSQMDMFSALEKPSLLKQLSQKKLEMPEKAEKPMTKANEIGR